MKPRTYIAIDLKSFYASVECVDRGLDPLATNLVVADKSRTEKTICLAVSPSLKSYGISGRARLFEVVQRVKQVNDDRIRRSPSRKLLAKSYDNPSLLSDPSLELDYIVAPPRMSRYMEVSAYIYSIYLKYISAEDIHVYSVDEVFMDVTEYLATYACSARDLVMRIIRDVLSSTGITATAGIGTNMYLAKVAMDIDAKHQEADSDGVRVAFLDEISYRKRLWDHRPLTDFWRVGRGISSRLQAMGINTMGELARASLAESWENHLYKVFGVNAELLIDHAWGWEPCTIADIKRYRPSSSSLSNGQVLSSAYDFEKARLVVKEMVDLLVLELVDKRLLTDQMVLTIAYDSENIDNKKTAYRGPRVIDHYGRTVPKPAHGSINLAHHSSSTSHIMSSVMELYDRIVDRNLTVRRIYVVANHVISEGDAVGGQLGLFDDPKELEKERKRQEAILSIRKKYGKNAILKGMNFEEGATARDRNKQIGGHKA